jgi:hypothetical protein
MILKAVIRLNHPAYMEIVLRKRMCLNIYTNFSITEILLKVAFNTITFTHVARSNELELNKENPYLAGNFLF